MAQQKSSRFMLPVFMIILLIVAGILLYRQLSSPQTTATTAMPTSAVSPTTVTQNTPPKEYIWEEVSGSASSGWITYHNPGLGMQISMPDTYIVENTNPELFTFHPPYVDATGRDGVSNKNLKLEIYSDRQNKPSTTLESFYASQQSEGKRERKETVTLGGKAVIHDYWTGLGDGESYFIVSNDYTALLMKYPQETVHQADFEKIISSIKFD